jgi:hypothetical protein
LTASTLIPFQLPAGGPARLVIVDAGGRVVRVLVDGVLPAGEHVAGWDGRDGAARRLASGVYFSRLEAGGRTASRKLLIVR